MVPWTGRPLSAVVSLVGSLELPEQEASGIRAAREAAQRRNERREGPRASGKVARSPGPRRIEEKPS